MVESVVLQDEIPPAEPLSQPVAKSFTLKSSDAAQQPRTAEEFAEEVWLLGSDIRSLEFPPFTLIRLCELAIDGLAKPYGTLRKYVWAVRKNLTGVSYPACSAVPVGFAEAWQTAVPDVKLNALEIALQCPTWQAAPVYSRCTTPAVGDASFAEDFVLDMEE